MNNIFLESNNIYLRALCLEDAETNYVNWLNDKEVCKFNAHHRFVNTKEKTIEYISRINSSKDCLVLAICCKEDNIHIGNVSIQSINYIDSNAEFAIVMGETNYQGKGFAYEASKLIINHAFNSLNLHRIYCGTSSENISMQKLAIKLGMKEEGTLKQAIFKNGQYIDIKLYGIINQK
ncbi:GNAT family N-acetyltransferase [Malaciobacter molluscorum LMG 25693]|uniref:Acetyltransferase n=1 Tax=Malaciobacter molluscorum LMG 25693 TaxID=870501 RepID=A0A2G1DFS6_9BACT|nr:GNAT family protein [Malaciobacter molluscorum]AXX93545.1 acetyltransferase [Malaciobacter molluscorum LMG 25693]PHO17300.1 GNAT family N-acetyltransferase [Malaciobacter molluscorum LMG 25693]